MIRYMRLYANFLRFSFSKAFEFRIDFYFRILMDIIYYAVNILFFKVIFLHSNILAGWTEAQVMVFVGAFIVIDALNMTIFANNFWAMPSLINKGNLDYYLLRPVSTLFFISFQDFAANSFVNLLIAGGILVWTMIQYPDPISILNLVLFLFLILNGTLLYAFVRLLFVLPVFWTHSSRGLDMMFWGFARFMERPHQIFYGAVRIILLTVLPFALMASLPTEVLFSSNPWPIVGYCVLLSCVFFISVLGLWRLGLRSYSSASS